MVAEGGAPRHARGDVGTACAIAEAGGYRLHSGNFSYKLLYYLVIGGISSLGEELGWRGFLQGSLRPLGRVRGYLLVALMWEAWHFTSHLKGTLTEVLTRLSIYVPFIVVVTFLLGFVVKGTDSLLLAVTLHEWLDIGVDSSGTYLMWAPLACIPLWLWLIRRGPGRTGLSTAILANEARPMKQTVATREERHTFSRKFRLCGHQVRFALVRHAHTGR